MLSGNLFCSFRRNIISLVPFQNSNPTVTFISHPLLIFRNFFQSSCLLGIFYLFDIWQYYICNKVFDAVEDHTSDGATISGSRGTNRLMVLPPPVVTWIFLSGMTNNLLGFPFMKS